MFLWSDVIEIEGNIRYELPYIHPLLAVTVDVHSGEILAFAHCSPSQSMSIPEIVSIKQQKDELRNNELEVGYDIKCFLEWHEN